MVLKGDGTKWACAACIKGHRVSACDHTDRELTFVPKKGRPVTQCSHCRGERKKRSAHVKCDCGITCTERGAPKQKCIHLPDPLSGASPSGSAPPITAVGAASAEPQAGHACCCHHGEACTCFTAKKDIDVKPDVRKPSTTTRVKPRLTSAQSDGHLAGSSTAHRKILNRMETTPHDNYRIHKHNTLPHHVTPHRSVDDLMVQAVSPTIQASGKSQKRRQNSCFEAMLGEEIHDAVPADHLNGALRSGPIEIPTTDGLSAAGNVIARGFPRPSMAFDAIDLNLDNVNWDNYPWDDAPVFKEPTNSAYASSNTISEFGAVTPVEQSVRPSAPATQAMTPWDFPHEQKVAGTSMPTHGTLQGRFSLPSSFQPGYSAIVMQDDTNLTTMDCAQFGNLQSATPELASTQMSRGTTSPILPMDFAYGVQQVEDFDGGPAEPTQWVTSELLPSRGVQQNGFINDFPQYHATSIDPFLCTGATRETLGFSQDYSYTGNADGWLQ